MKFGNPYYLSNDIPSFDYPVKQVDEEKYISLQDRIESFFNGSMLPSNDIDIEEYDQDEGDWNDPEPTNFDPSNDISLDEIDALQMSKEITGSMSETKKNLESKATSESLKKELSNNSSEGQSKSDES